MMECDEMDVIISKLLSSIFQLALAAVIPFFGG